MTVEKWNVDPAHSSIEFQVKHMMVSKVKGAFKDFSADLTLDPEDLTTASLAFTVDAASLDTRQAQRDGHLKSPDFFDVDNYPSITFKSTDITSDGDNEYKVTGDLTIREVTKPITLKVEYEGTSKDPMSGNMVAGFEGTGKFNRKDFGLNYNAALETGGVLIGDEVKLNIQIEISK
ncbi:polyisoprenoid-binding protein [Listeria weihenstephanensis]|uniref:Polyisoprenoid-binding protein n=1 Tax=Listeria weihenstephanensis TaxID=1006155 RepID=A0A841Z854_9LIST|nr:YceI family protein [Listeria weihenstephanensis]MBC1500576.1 polyisoprenoid-binding protein [Listeria weihenstephanensis]